MGMRPTVARGPPRVQEAKAERFAPAPFMRFASGGRHKQPIREAMGGFRP